jgi:hypothetical protein
MLGIRDNIEIPINILNINNVCNLFVVQHFPLILMAKRGSYYCFLTISAKI